MANDKDKERPGRPPEKRPYLEPRIEKLGHIADVTLKSGANPDTNQINKPGKGGG